MRFSVAHSNESHRSGLFRLRTWRRAAAEYRRARENDRFCLFFQPIESLTVDPHAGAHFELLLRMIGDDGIVPPSEFLPVAERYVLATRIDRWVIERALRWLSEDFARLAGM